MLELAAPDAPAKERPPLRLALVIDRSGSMQGDKLETTKACAAFLARRLVPGDELAVIAYDDQVDLVAPLGAVDPRALLPAIGAIESGGTTNLSGGWLKGLEVLGGSEGGVRKVLLLTDGQANVGITNAAQLVGMAQQAAGKGVGTTTIGFGPDFDESLLTAMADAGAGNAHYAPDPDAAPGIFSTEFEGLTAVVAQNVSVEIRPGPDVAVVGVLNRYPATEVSGGVQLALGDAYGGERRSVVFQLHLPTLAVLGPTKVADVVVRYVAVGDQIAAHELTLPVMVNVATAEEAAAAAADHAVTEEVTILAAAQARDTARRLADEGRFTESQAALQRAARDIRGLAPGSPRADELLAEADRLEATAKLADPSSYGPRAAKAMHYDSHSSRRRRR